MTPIPFGDLLCWIFSELETDDSAFGILRSDFWRASGGGVPLFGKMPEVPVGIADGPYTQYTQGIVSGYLSGARFFELMTLRGAFSGGLSAHVLYEEYVKAWVLLHVLGRVLGIGRADGFVFDMSVGCDWAEARSGEVNAFVDGLICASGSEIYRYCIRVLKSHLTRIPRLDERDIDEISSAVCNSATLSAQRGVPPEEIERAAARLIDEKSLNVSIKCGPSLLGYEGACEALDRLGLDSALLERSRFDGALRLTDAVPMIRRLQAQASERGLEFGVRLTGEPPVKTAGEGSTGEDARRACHRSLAVIAAKRLSEELRGSLRIALSGGADARQAAELLEAGVWPVTASAELSGPGGYARMRRIAVSAAATQTAAESDAAALAGLAERWSLPCAEPAGAQEKLPPGIPLVDCFDPQETGAPGRGGICRACCEVCPNRANVCVVAGGVTRIVHLDALCDECGLCSAVCPYDGAPYREKFTCYKSESDFDRGGNSGFVLPGDGSAKVRVGADVFDHSPGAAPAFDTGLAEIIAAVVETYSYLL